VKGLQAKNKAGFTLVELITVMTLIGIMAAVALPKLSNVMSAQSPGYRDQMMATINYARKIAVGQRRHVCVSIAASTVTVTSDHGLPVNHTNGTCPSTLALSSGTNVVTAPSNVTASPAVSLDFDAQGRPVTGAPATITITDTSSSQTSTLTIEAESGYVH
jgi:MSHA pilin protein MshC